MLEELSIRNYALVDAVSLSFRPGFNVLTGETGAGKSIIVGSLSFLMGAKAEADVIRTGAEEAGVSALVSIQDSSGEALEWLKSRGMEPEDGTVIVRRNIKTGGRGSIYIQNVPCTRTDLAGFMSLLFDLHGQHNHESLLRKESHRRYLDRFAGLEGEAGEFNRVFLELAEKRKALEASLGSERDRETRLELLSYAVEEIGRANPRPGETGELENEAQRLSDFGRLAGLVNDTAHSLFENDASVLSVTRRARNALDGAAAIDGSLGELRKRVEDLYYEAEDISGEFRSYRDRLSYDPARQEAVDERLALLYKLRKKYASAAGDGAAGAAENRGGAEEAILAYRARAEAEMEFLANAGENRDNLKAEIAALEKDIAARAASLRQKRSAGALGLGEKITAILTRLGMPNARFSAAILPKGREGAAARGEGAGAGEPPASGAGSLVCGPWGAEDVEFLISANTGEPLKDLARIASGGELSRVMLAIKTVLVGGAAAPGGALNHGPDSVETLVFDEIDTGIGGEVALSVGEYLAKIGAFRQIFCVTHLASIAVRADNHFRVEKKTEGGRTFTGVGPLDAGERRREIARMLAGDAGDAALAHADDLILKYGRGKR
ncbi:MAG: DNA repair protein RecN [Treponema sp.]|jgi:DNA repair protein RecN (Recombination protein N)|nr:DNA repair protein RecN [Treponema sp.]